MGRSCLIIGAGASGLTAAVCAARAGASVTVLEHKASPGIKLALTGNGRCNYTNTDAAPDKYSCDDSKFISEVLDIFGYDECIDFFRGIGIEPEIRHYAYDTSGYVYPKDSNAAGFRDRLYAEAMRLGVKFEFNVPDSEICSMIIRHARTECGDGIGTANAAGASTPNAYSAADSSLDNIIIAAGSNAYPKTGSDSSVYPALKQLGINLNRFLPALCALFSKDSRLAKMKGQRVRAEAVLKIYELEASDGDDCTKYSCSGEIQFNEHSISGIPVMQISRYASEAISKGHRTVLNVCGHDYEIHRTAGFDKAQVCSGGISVHEMDPHSMRYKDSNIYFCGEIIDVDGQCGGYNLHFAWASGYIAGMSAAGAKI